MGQTQDEERPTYKRIFSASAILFVTLACPCQIALTIFDSDGHKGAHHTLLFLALVGTSCHAVCTGIVFWDETRQESTVSLDRKNKTRNGKIRERSVRVSEVLIVTELILGIAFTVLLQMSFYTVSGIVEWAMAFLFTFYFWAFVGFLLEEEEEGKVEGEEGERTALLR